LTPSDGITYRAALCLSAEAQRCEKVLNSSATIDSVTTPDSGVVAAQSVWRDVKDGRLSRDFGAKLWEMTKDLGPVVRGAYRRFVEEQPVVPPYSEIYLYSRSEQAPNPDSRVLLSDERDALGMRRADLDWRLTPLDKRTVKVMVQAIGVELARLNLARVRIDDWLLEGGDQWDEEMGGGHHHMGTTRMTDDPQMGVVDKNCRMHRVENLYVAGSSVFPTSGYVNPTLTIVALALRLADHFKTRLS
jgi:choline dehydrogenase-like flavoprotein